MKRMLQVEKDRARKATDAYKTQHQSSKYTTSSSQHHYGPDSQQPDASPDELEQLCHEYFEREVQVTEEQGKAIEMATRQQTESLEWYLQRQLRITASNFGNITRRRNSTPVANTVKQLLYKRPFNAPSLHRGRMHEDDARKAYLHQMSGAVTTRCCLVIDHREPCLACSPDDIVTLATGEQGLVEYKCPYKATKESLTPQQAAVQLRGFCSTLSVDGQLQLKRTHARLLGDHWQALVPLRAMDTKEIKYRNNSGRSWLLGACLRIIEFYRQAVLPELVLPRYSNGQPIREPFDESA